VKKTLAIVLVFLLGACSLSNMQEGFLDQDVKAMLKDLNQALVGRDGDYFFSHAHSSIVNEKLPGSIGEVFNSLPVGEPETIELATVNYQTVNMISGYSSKTYNVSYHLSFGTQFVLVSYVLVDEGQGYKIAGLHANKSPVSFKEINAFTKVPLTPLKVAVFLLALAVVVFIIWVFVLAMREKNLKLKPLWGVFILLGFGGFVINWTTGAWVFQLFSFSLLGAGYSAAGHFSPIIFKVAFPLGAVVFLILKKKGKLKYKQPKAKKPKGSTSPQNSQGRGRRP